MIPLFSQAGQKEMTISYALAILAQKRVSRSGCTAFLDPRYGTWSQWLLAALSGVLGTCGSRCGIAPYHCPHGLTVALEIME